MLKAWKEQRSFTITEALTTARSGTYLAMFNQKQGLLPEMSGLFALSMGFRVASQTPQSQSPNDRIDLMKARGPLGVMTFNPAHARLMTGMWGDEPGVQVRVIDPLPGIEQRVSYTEFVNQFASAPDNTAQIWHC